MWISSYFWKINCRDAHFVWGANPEVVRQQCCEGRGCSASTERVIGADQAHSCWSCSVLEQAAYVGAWKAWRVSLLGMRKGAPGWGLPLLLTRVQGETSRSICATRFFACVKCGDRDFVDFKFSILLSCYRNEMVVEELRGLNITYCTLVVDIKFNLFGYMKTMGSRTTSKEKGFTNLDLPSPSPSINHHLISRRLVPCRSNILGCYLWIIHFLHF
jgi:hypothetical protein